MRKMMMAAIALLMAVTANAQYLNDSEKVFSQDKWYVGASLSGFDLNYHKGSDWKMDVNAKAGYLIADDWMIVGQAGYKVQEGTSSAVVLGAGMRYYFESCGVYAGATAKYAHFDHISDFRPEISAGYAYFLTGKLTIEPWAYFEYSTKSSDYTGFGVRIGFGLYF